MAFTYSFGDNPSIDQVRLLVADTDSTHPIFDDREITMAYQLALTPCYPPVATQAPRTYGTARAWHVAAVLLLALAGNKSRLAGALEVLDIKISLAAAAKELRETAKLFQAQDDNVFAIAEVVNTPAAGRERWLNQLLRAA